MTHGSVRVYKIMLEGKDQTELRSITADEDLRPRVGDQIKLEDYPTEIFKITRCIPADNPEGQEVTYIVEYESDRNLIAGGSIANFPQHFVRSPWNSGIPSRIYY